MHIRGSTTVALAACLALGLAQTAGAAAAPRKEITIGAQCDHSGPTQAIGAIFCPAVQDYVNLINSQGGVDGYKVILEEQDNNYQVPSALAAYQQQKQDGAISMLIWGTPQAVALNPRLEQDHIPGTSPGFGPSAAANGAKYPYLFPLAPTSWSQAAAAIKFIKDKLGGSLQDKRIAYVYYDDDAGREALPILEALQQTEDFQLQFVTVPPSETRMDRLMEDMAARYRPDFVLTQLFGPVASVMIKEINNAGYPLDRVLGFAWAASEADIAAAGGWSATKDYHVLQFAGVGHDYPVLAQIRAMYEKAGKPPPKAMDASVYYNRGVEEAALQIEALRNALKLTGGEPPTGEDMKKGFEMIKDFTLGGLVPPLQVTSSDHEGGGWVRVYHVEDNQLEPETGWFHAYRKLVLKSINAAS